VASCECAACALNAKDAARISFTAERQFILPPENSNNNLAFERYRFGSASGGRVAGVPENLHG
jgi:hypothetical protein